MGEKTAIQQNRQERLDMIMVKDVYRLIERMTFDYVIKLEGFHEYFTINYSLKKTCYVITLGAFISLLLSYIEETFHLRHAAPGQSPKKEYHMETEAIRIQGLKSFLFAEVYEAEERIITKKL